MHLIYNVNCTYGFHALPVLFATGAELASGLRKTRTFFYAPWDHMPVHIRGGAIIPTQVH